MIPGNIWCRLGRPLVFLELRLVYSFEGKEIYSWTCDQYPGGSDSGRWYFSIYKADKLLVQVGGATYKTDSMVVVVRADDSAKTLEDAKIIAMESRQVLMLRIQTRCWKM